MKSIGSKILGILAAFVLFIVLSNAFNIKSPFRAEGSLLSFQPVSVSRKNNVNYYIDTTSKNKYD